MELLIQKLCPGIVSGAAVSLILIWWQFSRSTAGYRVNMVRRATSALTDPNAKRSLLRNKYRYSLGVIIDDLHQSFKEGFPENGNWPALIDNGTPCDGQVTELGDRWRKFNRYIRPVIEDINTYSFIGFLQLTPALRHLNMLTDLCHRLEDVVSELDAAFENKVVCNKNNRICIVCKRDDANKEADIDRLRNAYRELYQVWCKWLASVKEDDLYQKTHNWSTNT